MDIQELVIYLDRKGCRLRGCSLSQIEKIERHHGARLPLTYVEFLYAMGVRAGRFMEGSSMFYNEIFDLREGAIEVLAENNFKPLPDNAFVFYMHQGYQFAFFKMDEGDNPPVYYYSEGRPQDDFERTDDSFTAFLESAVKMSGLD